MAESIKPISQLVTQNTKNEKTLEINVRCSMILTFTVQSYNSYPDKDFNHSHRDQLNKINERLTLYSLKFIEKNFAQAGAVRAAYSKAMDYWLNYYSSIDDTIRMADFNTCVIFVYREVAPDLPLLPVN